MNNSKEYVKKELKMEDLEPQHQEIANIIGLDKYIELCWTMCGAGIYLPSERWLFQQIAKRKIYESRALVKSKSVTVKQLAKIYGISESAAYKYIKEAGI